MSEEGMLKEEYRNGADVIHYVVYQRPEGIDEVLQHKLKGLAESAHITLHPDGSVNFRVVRFKKYLEEAIATNLRDYSPRISHRVKSFITKVREKGIGIESEE